MAEADLRSLRFRGAREQGWQRLEALLAQVETSGHRALSHHELVELARLYRETAHALAVAREISLDAALLRYLEALVGRGYFAVHAPPHPLGGLAARFLRHSAPRALWTMAPFILLAAAVMAIAGLVAAALYASDASWFYTFMPAELAGGRTPAASTDYLREAIYPDTHGLGLGAFAAFLFSNNARVAIFAFGLGLLGMVPALLIIFYNGLILGAFVALHVERGLGWDIFAWLSIHGVTELGAIAVAGGAGMAVGWAALSPGQRRRGAAMRAAGRAAVPAAVVAIIMLVAAAFLEGYGRQLVQDPAARLAVGWGIGALWLAWGLSAWPKRRRKASPAS